MFCTAAISAATASHPSAHHHWRSPNSPQRRTYKSATAANRCAIAVDSSRVASPITSMRSPSEQPSNIHSTMPQSTDSNFLAGSRYPQCGLYQRGWVGVMVRSRRTKVAPADKLRVVVSVLAGEMSCREAARRLGVSADSVVKWKHQFLEAGA